MQKMSVVGKLDLLQPSALGDAPCRSAPSKRRSKVLTPRHFDPGANAASRISQRSSGDQARHRSRPVSKIACAIVPQCAPKSTPKSAKSRFRQNRARRPTPEGYTAFFPPTKSTRTTISTSCTSFSPGRCIEPAIAVPASTRAACELAPAREASPRLATPSSGSCQPRPCVLGSSRLWECSPQSAGKEGKAIATRSELK